MISNNILSVSVHEGIDQHTIQLEWTLDDLPYANDNASYIYVDEKTYSDLDQSVGVDPNPGYKDTINAIHNPSTFNNISVHWPKNNLHYFENVIAIKRSDPVQFHISYDDCDKEAVNLRSVVWFYSDDPVLSCNVTKLVSNKHTDRRKFYDVLTHKELMKLHAQGLPRCFLYKEYRREKATFKNPVNCGPNSSISSDTA